MRKLEHLDLVAARSLGPDAVNEVSLSRVWQHVQAAGDKSFGVLTSYRAAPPQSAPSAIVDQDRRNRETLADLKRELRAADLGFFRLTGRYKESHPEGDVWVEEPSFFVPRMPLDLVLRLRQKYDQDSVLYAGPETGGEVTAFERDGSKKNLGKFHPKTIADYYSELKGGRRFTFEGNDGPGSWMMAASEHALKRDASAMRERAEGVLRDLREFYAG